MAFIDIFNFKKYFIAPSDSQAARYGHVNALYDELGPRIKNPGSYRTTDSFGIILPVTTYSGVVDLPNLGIAPGSGNDNPGMIEIEITSDLIKSTSIVIMTPVNITPDLYTIAQSSTTNGSFSVLFYNYSPNEIEGIKFNYLIIS